MFKCIEDVLTRAQVAELNAIADRAAFVDGRITNPNNPDKVNVQLGDQDVVGRTAQVMANGLFQHEEFRNFVFPAAIAPPLLTIYRTDMRYGLHSDAAFMPWQGRMHRSDVSCTIFLSDPESYDGGALRVTLGDREVQIKLPAGAAVLYPSDTLHEVTPVTRGERRVGLTFIQSRIANAADRDTLFQLNEVAALEGLTMRPENYVRLQLVQQRLLRAWSDPS